jgi:hypothetical protein
MIRLVNLATLTTNTKEQALQTILDLLNNMGNRKLAMHLVDLLIVVQCTMSLDCPCPFMIAPSVSSNVHLDHHMHFEKL